LAEIEEVGFSLLDSRPLLPLRMPEIILRTRKTAMQIITARELGDVAEVLILIVQVCIYIAVS
jgi:hypothetical protein